MGQADKNPNIIRERLPTIYETRQKGQRMITYHIGHGQQIARKRLSGAGA